MGILTPRFDEITGEVPMVLPTSTLHPGLLVSDVMELWPETVQIFVHHHMACPGCPIAGFHTLAEIAAEYRMDIDGLLAELRACQPHADSAGHRE